LAHFFYGLLNSNSSIKIKYLLVLLRDNTNKDGKKIKVQQIKNHSPNPPNQPLAKYLHNPLATNIKNRIFAVPKLRGIVNVLLI